MVWGRGFGLTLGRDKAEAWNGSRTGRRQPRAERHLREEPDKVRSSASSPSELALRRFCGVVLEAQRSTPLIGYKRRMTKEIVTRESRSTDINSNEIIEEESDDAYKKDIADHVSKPKRRKTTPSEGRRNRASPARLFKMNKLLVPDQKGAVLSKELGICWTLLPVVCRGTLANG